MCVSVVDFFVLLSFENDFLFSARLSSDPSENVACCMGRGTQSLCIRMHHKLVWQLFRRIRGGHTRLWLTYPAWHELWAILCVDILSSLLVSINHIVMQIEGTMGMCYTYLQEISREKGEDDADGTGKKAAKTKKLRSDPMFQAVMREIEMQKNKGFAVHPKMDRLKALAVQHFADKLEDGGEAVDASGEGQEGREETRVMVFVTFRECVDEIVEALNIERPLIRATKFIGQGTDKQGKKGMTQKEQLEVRQDSLLVPAPIVS
jgi:hypothetical protein